jgi:hypothetical protein
MSDIKPRVKLPEFRDLKATPMSRFVAPLTPGF